LISYTAGQLECARLRWPTLRATDAKSFSSVASTMGKRGDGFEDLLQAAGDEFHQLALLNLLLQR
jgi:hypothetical protein